MNIIMRTCHFTVHGKDFFALVCQWTDYGGHETISAVHIITHMNLSRRHTHKKIWTHPRSLVIVRVEGFLWTTMNVQKSPKNVVMQNDVAISKNH